MEQLVGLRGLNQGPESFEQALGGGLHSPKEFRRLHFGLMGFGLGI